MFPLPALQSAHCVRTQPCPRSKFLLSKAGDLPETSEPCPERSFLCDRHMSSARLFLTPTHDDEGHRRYAGMVARGLAASRTFECTGQRPSGVGGAGSHLGALCSQIAQASGADEKNVKG